MSLTHITTCLLCDPAKPKKFVAQSMPELTPGEQPPKAIGKFIQALGAHLAKEHPEALASIQQMGAMFQALILMKNFQTTDPGVHRAADIARHFIHKLTQRAEIRPTDVANFLTGCGVDLKRHDFESVIALSEMILEDGQYAPLAPEPSRIVTA